MTESEKMSWDLSQLVKVDDPGYIEERMKAAVKEMEDFREQHPTGSKDRCRTGN